MPHFQPAPEYSGRRHHDGDEDFASICEADPVPPYEEVQTLSLKRRATNLSVDRAVLKEHTSANRASKRLEAIGDETIVNLERYGNSAWAATIKLTTKKADGDTHDYFLKLIRGDLAGPRVLGEYACMFELAKTMPSLVPMPRAAGRCLDADDGAFFMCDYLEIDHRPANPAQLGRKIAELHRSSVSPNGKFGFHTTPYDGKLPLCAEWDSSWTSFFTKLLKGVYQLDAQVNGSWPELDDAMHLTLQTVIPRLLNRLIENGRTVKPCLIHGDLHEQNIGTEPRTGNLFIFDSCSYYAHHEMAMGMWRVDHHNMKAREYRREYFENYPPDEPQEEADDRNRLYSVKEEIMYSAHVPGSKSRAQALENLRYLIDKYVEYEDSEEDDELDAEEDDSSDERGSLMRHRS